MAIRYLPASELSQGEILAGYQSGVIRPWRRDAVTGEQWYQVGQPDIHGVSPQDAAEQAAEAAAEQAAEAEFIEMINDPEDDEPCEFFTSEGEDDA